MFLEIEEINRDLLRNFLKDNNIEYTEKTSGDFYIKKPDFLLHIECFDEDFSCYCPILQAEENSYEALTEFICRVNYNLINRNSCGAFWLDYNTGTVEYKILQMPTIPVQKIFISTVIYNALDDLSRCSTVFYRIINGKISPKQAEIDLFKNQ